MEPLGAGRCRTRIRADALDRPAFRLILLDAEFTVEEPSELIEHL